MFYIKGFADPSESGTALDLAERRAAVVRTYLVANGIDESRLATLGDLGMDLSVLPRISSSTNWPRRVALQVSLASLRK